MSGRSFWKGETWAIIQAMKATGNRAGIIAAWKDQIQAWAENNPKDPHSASVLSWLPHWQVRPFYTADELAPLWPALAIVIGYTDKWPSVPKSARRLEFELDYAGLPRLPGPRNNRYFIVERIHYWTKADPTEIENAQR